MASVVRRAAARAALTSVLQSKQHGVASCRSSLHWTSRRLAAPALVPLQTRCFSLHGKRDAEEDWYAILGLPASATHEQIKAQYRELGRESVVTCCLSR